MNKDLEKEINNLKKKLGANNLKLFLKAVNHGIWVHEWLTYPNKYSRQEYPAKGIKLAEDYSGFYAEQYSSSLRDGYGGYRDEFIKFSDFGSKWGFNKQEVLKYE